jgi:arylsulfatase A-like enzyme
MARIVLLSFHLFVHAQAKNVLFFMPDDGDLGSSSLTPNFNRIRSEGVIFNSAFVAGTSCAPSRFNIITGRYCSRSTFAQANPLTGDGLTYVDSSNTCKLDGDDLVMNLAHQLNVHGQYRTIISGKWHLAQRTSKFNDYAADVETVRNAGFSEPVAIYIENLPRKESRFSELGFSHNTEWLTATANAAIEDAVINENAPFFVYFTPTCPHVPSTLQALTDFQLVDTPSGTLDVIPDHGHEFSRAQVVDMSGGNEHSAAMIWNDNALGSLMAKMGHLGVLNETLIIVAMDHGEPKFGMQQSSASISMFARLPGRIQAGSFINFPTSHLDIAPTIFEYTGIVPDEGYHTDGKSWYGAATGKNLTSTRSCVIFEHFQNRAVSCDYLGMKLSFYHSTGSFELYDFVADPLEQEDVYGVKAYAETQAFLETYLNCHMESTNPSDLVECDPENSSDDQVTLGPTIQLSPMPSLRPTSTSSQVENTSEELVTSSPSFTMSPMPTSLPMPFQAVMPSLAPSSTTTMSPTTRRKRKQTKKERRSGN